MLELRGPYVGLFASHSRVFGVFYTHDGYVVTKVNPLGRDYSRSSLCVNRYRAWAGGAIDMLKVADDFGTQKSTFFSRAMWQDFLGENMKRLADLVRRHGAFFMTHSCGAIRPIIPGLIACGMDIIKPIQKLPCRKL